MSNETTSRPTLCLAMIVKNEERNLKEWLPAAANHCDEIVIVDTGSTDGTIPFLESLPVRILRQTWAFDFALHRNHGLDHVSSDWVLILDADERIDEAGWKTLRTLLSDETAMAFLFQVKNYHTPDNPSGYDVMRSYRLFRSGYGIRYEGAVHNQLAPAIVRACAAHGKRIVDADIQIEHFGYALEKPAMQAKQERIYRMVRKQLFKTPDDPYYLYHLLNICLATRKLDEARQTISRLAFEDLRPELRVQAYYKAAQIYIAYDEYDVADDFIRSALQIQPKAAFLHYLKSNILFQTQRYDHGLRAAYKALEYAGQPRDAQNAIYIPVEECLTNIGLGYLLGKEYTSASSYFREALRLNPAYQAAARYLAWIEKQVITSDPRISTTAGLKPMSTAM